jgi:CarD family transcriptional regulator, regulator of rRNA transcription
LPVRLFVFVAAGAALDGRGGRRVGRWSQAERAIGLVRLPRGYPGGVRLAVGVAVVYGRHGTGRVVARERRVVLGVEREVVLLELGHGLCVMLPIEQARERLRAVASEADVRQVQRTLHADAEASVESWRQRLKQGRAKLASGGPRELAEIVRDAVRHQSLARKGAAPKLSASEQNLYVQARQLLAQEIGLARGLEQVEADAWIEEQVALV